MAELSGVAADAARTREDVLVARNQSAAGVDVELQNVLRSAHQTQTQLRGRLDAIERALDEGVSGAGNLTSPAAKRAFQEFLLGKQRQIVQVLQDAKSSAAGLTTQMTGVGGQYQPAGSDGADSAVKPASVQGPLKTDGTPPLGGGGSYGGGPPVDPNHHDGQFAPPPPVTAPPPDMPPRATGPLQPPAGVAGGSQGIGMSSLSVDPTHHEPAPPAPITTIEDSQRPAGGDPHGSMGMGPGVADTTHPQPPAGAGPIYRDPRELGPAGMVEQFPHSGVWVRPDQVDHNVFTIAPHAMAPSNAVYVGTAPNGDEIWRYADPGPR